MKNLFLTLSVVILSAPAWAAGIEVTAEPLAPLPGADILVTGEGPNEIIPSEQPAAVAMPPQPVDEPAAQPEQANFVCQGYQTMSQVQGPNYVAGVDAYGAPVAPADVSSTSAFDVPERIDVPVAINVAQAMNLPGTPTEMNVTPGTVTVFKDGRVLYNGQDVSTQVSAYCANQPKPELNVTVQ